MDDGCEIGSKGIIRHSQDNILLLKVILACDVRVEQWTGTGYWTWYGPFIPFIEEPSIRRLIHDFLGLPPYCKLITKVNNVRAKPKWLQKGLKPILLIPQQSVIVRRIEIATLNGRK